MIKDVFERHVLGMDPFQIETLWRSVYGTGYTLRPDISLMGVLSAIEMALWDIIGKAVGKPVYELLGGKVHERLRSYTYLYPDDRERARGRIYRDAEMSAERAAEYVKQGFTAVKFDPAGAYSAFDPRQPSLETLDAVGEVRAACIREAVGHQGRSPVRHARPVHRRRAPSASRSGSSHTIRSGSRSRRRRRCRRRWRWSRARPPSRSPPASA